MSQSYRNMFVSKLQYILICFVFVNMSVWLQSGTESGFLMGAKTWMGGHAPRPWFRPWLQQMIHPGLLTTIYRGRNNNHTGYIHDNK